MRRSVQHFWFATLMLGVAAVADASSIPWTWGGSPPTSLMAEVPLPEAQIGSVTWTIDPHPTPSTADWEWQLTASWGGSSYGYEFVVAPGVDPNTVYHDQPVLTQRLSDSSGATIREISIGGGFELYCFAQADGSTRCADGGVPDGFFDGSGFSGYGWSDPATWAPGPLTLTRTITWDLDVNEVTSFRLHGADGIGYILTFYRAVPEPSTFALGALGIASLCAIRPLGRGALRRNARS